MWQEFAAARKPPVFCFGRVCIDSIEFSKLTLSLHKNKAESVVHSSNASSPTSASRPSRRRTTIEHIGSLRNCLDNLENLRAGKRASVNLPFAEMLSKTVEAEATDPRDRIFSLIGFLKPEAAFYFFYLLFFSQKWLNKFKLQYFLL